MNYLGHYVYNHTVCGLEPQPYFALGVVLPDLWPRFSRRRRIRWRAVRSATVSNPRVAQLRDGLLNHVAVDQRFHALPSFVRWQRELKQRVVGSVPHSAVIDFLAHVALELMLDHRVVREEPRAAEEIYDRIGSCSFDFVEQEIGLLGDVDARGLAEYSIDPDQVVRAIGEAGRIKPERYTILEEVGAERMVAVFKEVYGLG